MGLSSRFGHLDSTSFHVDGRYDQESETGVIHLTKGYSRDHRPDLNQVVLQLLCERQAGIPLLMQTLNGNNRDKESFREMIGDFTEQMRNDFKLEYLIANSALYSAENLKFMNTWKWISRVPETLRLTAIKLRKNSPLPIKEGPGWLKKLILFNWLITTPSPPLW